MSKFIGHPEFRVHAQTGSLRGALRGRLVGHGNYRVWLDTGVAPHAAYVIRGTRVMLGRDVLWDTATAPGTRKEIMRTAISVLGKAMKTQAAIRFTDDPAGSLRMTIMAMGNTKISMKAAARVAAGVMGANLMARIDANINLRDHTLRDLARQGHPYARRHGNIRIHQ